MIQSLAQKQSAIGEVEGFGITPFFVETPLIGGFATANFDHLSLVVGFRFSYRFTGRNR
jgi:hypothetical protein